MENLEIILLTSFISFSLGVFSTLLLTKKGLSIAQIVGLVFLALYASFMAHSQFVTKVPLDIYVHAGGLAALSTLLGLEAPALLQYVIPRKK